MYYSYPNSAQNIQNSFYYEGTHYDENSDRLIMYTPTGPMTFNSIPKTSGSVLRKILIQSEILGLDGPRTENQHMPLPLYSSTGLDIFGILAKLYNRPNPKIKLTSNDFGSAMIITGPSPHNDYPILYVNEAFERLTLYSRKDVIGRNCRFLQSPRGIDTRGTRRVGIPKLQLENIKKSITSHEELQQYIYNHKKNGKGFINSLRVIPVKCEKSGTIIYYIAFIEELKDINKNEKAEGRIPLSKDLATTMQNGNQNIIAKQEIVSPPTTSDGRLLTLMTTMPSLISSSTQDWESFHEIFKINDFIYVLSLDGQFLFVSHSCANVLGFTKEELIGHFITEFIPASDLEDLNQELFSNNREFRVGCRFRRRIGDYIFMDMFGQVLRKEGVPDSQKTKAIIVGRERIRDKLVLHPSLIADDSIWIKLSSYGLILHTGSLSKINDIFNIPIESIVGTSILDFILPEFKPLLVKNLQYPIGSRILQVEALNSTWFYIKIHVSQDFIRYGQIFFDLTSFETIHDPETATDVNLLELKFYPIQQTLLNQLVELDAENRSIEKEIDAFTTFMYNSSPSSFSSNS